MSHYGKLMERLKTSIVNSPWKGKGGSLLVKSSFCLVPRKNWGFGQNLNKQIWDFLNDFTYSKLSILSPKFLIYNIWFGRLIKAAQNTIIHTNHQI